MSLTRGLFTAAIAATLVVVWTPFAGARAGTQATNLQFGTPGGDYRLLHRV